MMERLRIFAASPSDMATERAKVETVASLLKPLADHLGIVLEVVDWRSVVPNMGRRRAAKTRKSRRTISRARKRNSRPHIACGNNPASHAL
jgi:hypothetical protein